MVVFVDFEQDGDETLLHQNAADHGKPGLHVRGVNSEPHRQQDPTTGIADYDFDHERINPNVNSFSAILSCYPYALCLHGLDEVRKG